MPGKHAPGSPRSFYLSLGRVAAGVLAGIGLVVVVIYVATAKNPKHPSATPTVSPSVTVTPEVSPTETLPIGDVPTATPTSGLRAPSKVTVAVLNGTSRAGLASKVGKQLSHEGYKIVRKGNAGHAARSVIYYQSGAEPEARALLSTHPEFGDVQPALPTTPKNALVTVVLGDDYP